jgi:uncharacterized protein (UPF0332 family)
MSDREALLAYRVGQAKETLADAKEMMQAKLSPRSITNRAYYTMFYTLLALFLGSGIHLKTSKHVGVISIFDREFVHTGKVDVKYSKALHKVFDLRLESDYRELADISVQDATEALSLAEEFLQMALSFIEKAGL